MNLHNIKLESVYAKGEDGEFHLVARRDECETKTMAETDYISHEALLSATEGYDWQAGLKTVLKRIPAADVRPVVRGEWIKHNATHVQKGGMYLECSCCHEYITVLGHVFAYCPNCGADMREES